MRNEAELWHRHLADGSVSDLQLKEELAGAGATGKVYAPEGDRRAKTRIQRSSVVERSAVNRLVVGSNPTAGAKTNGLVLCEIGTNLRLEIWLRGRDLNPRPSGYEPDELPGCSTPRLEA